MILISLVVDGADARHSKYFFDMSFFVEVPLNAGLRSNDKLREFCEDLVSVSIAVFDLCRRDRLHLLFRAVEFEIMRSDQLDFTP